MPLHYGTQQNGYQAGMESASNVAYNRGGNPASITGPAPFDFISGYMTAAWYDGLQVEVRGYIGNTLAYDNLYTPSATAPTLINFDYLGVNEVAFDSFGGTVHPGYNNGGEMFVLDNLMVTVPEPSAAALAGFGSAVLLLGRMNLRTKICRQNNGRMGPSNSVETLNPPIPQSINPSPIPLFPLVKRPVLRKLPLCRFGKTQS